MGLETLKARWVEGLSHNGYRRLGRYVGVLLLATDL